MTPTPERNGSSKLTWIIVGGAIVFLAGGASGWLANNDTSRSVLERNDARQDQALRDVERRLGQIENQMGMR